MWKDNSCFSLTPSPFKRNSKAYCLCLDSVIANLQGIQGIVGGHGPEWFSIIFLHFTPVLGMFVWARLQTEEYLSFPLPFHLRIFHLDLHGEIIIRWYKWGKTYCYIKGKNVDGFQRALSMHYSSESAFLRVSNDLLMSVNFGNCAWPHIHVWHIYV